MPRRAGIPSYRRRVIRGREIAITTLRDAVTGDRRDITLGPYGSQESRAAYSALIAGWTAAGYRLPPSDVPRGPGRTLGGATFAQVCDAFMSLKGPEYSGSERANFESVARVALEIAPHIHANDLTPATLRAVRDAMIRGNALATDAAGAPRPRKPWARKTVNSQIQRLRMLVRWAVGQALVLPHVLESLRAVEPLRRGRTAARETPPVGPVAADVVDATLPLLRPQVRAMVELQRLTGMRSGEVVIMRTADLDMSGDVWVYRPSTHKTAHHGHSREISLGPRAQAIIRPWLRTALDEYLFQPREAVRLLRAARTAARVTELERGNRPGMNRVDQPRRTAADRYTSNSYRRAIIRACDRADEAAQPQSGGGGKRLVPRWHPHQLRHSFLTAVRAAFGIEAARVAGGHHSLDVTELYAERDRHVGVDVARRLG